MWDKSKKTDLLQILIPDKRRPKVRFFSPISQIETTFVSNAISRVCIEQKDHIIIGIGGAS